MTVLKPIILVVDDNEDILFNLRIMLDKKGYDVISSTSGDLALKSLSTLERLPEVIISDIMMPGMNGYELFSSVSEKPKWNHIPFLFLTAKSTPEDIRLGKMLGVDDYITKPFKEQDLLASIAGKIARNKKSLLFSNEITKLLANFNIESKPSLALIDKNLVNLFLVQWDDVAGPILKNNYPSIKQYPFSINEISKQLFHAASSIYGHGKITKAEGFLLNIENIKFRGYVFFDAFPDNSERFGEKQYMLSVIAPTITYFDSLKIRDILKQISAKIKNKQEWDIKDYWEKVLEILFTRSLNLTSIRV